MNWAFIYLDFSVYANEIRPSAIKQIPEIINTKLIVPPLLNSKHNATIIVKIGSIK